MFALVSHRPEWIAWLMVATFLAHVIAAAIFAGRNLEDR